MNPRLCLFIVLLVMLSGCAGVTTPISDIDQSYVEPSLWTAESETLAVIVTAGDSRQAAEIVERVGGRVVSDLWLIDAVAATIPANRLATLAAEPGLVSIVADKKIKTADWPDWITTYRFPVPWDGSPDAQVTADPKVWKLVNPVAIDVGADVLHKRSPSITGQGITVAVLDSGVRFSNPVKIAIGGSTLLGMFKGQADFVGSGTCPGVGIQFSGYCFTNYSQSYDGYGHGSHVAGIIWNKFTDNSTGVSMGIAPNANILSVRVLNASGSGSYTDVIEGIQFVVNKKSTYNIRILNVSLSANVTTPYFADPLNRAIEQAWANGIVVVAAAGNTGARAEAITVPGNDPYVITVGAINGNRTPGYWLDDILPAWSASGPTWDGFAKPDVLAPGNYIVSFMYVVNPGAAATPGVVVNPGVAANLGAAATLGPVISPEVASAVSYLACHRTVPPWPTLSG